MKHLFPLLKCGVVLCGLSMTAACAIAQELPQPIEETVVAQPALLDQLRAGTMTAEAAWDKKLLDEKSALALLEGGAFGGEQARDQKLRAAIAGLLIQHAPERVRNTAGLSVKVVQALAEYYASVGDKRAVALYEVAVKGTKPPYEKGLLLLNLGHFYRSLGDRQKAVETYLRARPVFLEGGHKSLAAEALVEAGRMYKGMGQTQKAAELYAQVAQYGNGWMSGMAIWDQAGRLISKGEHEQARKLLRQPVTGPRAEEIRPALLTQMAYSYYLTRDFATARKYATQALAEYKALENPPLNDGLLAQVNVSQDVLDWSARWDQSPIPLVCNPSEMDLVMPRSKKPGEAKAWPFSILSLDFATTTITTDNPQVTVRPLDDKPAHNFGIYFEKGMILEVSMTALQKSVDATLFIKSPQFPDATIRVPIHVAMQQDD